MDESPNKEKSGVPSGVKPVISEAGAAERDAARTASPGSGRPVVVAARPKVSTASLRLTSLIPGPLVIRDSPSGEVYRWPKSGAEVLVRAEDVDYLLSFNHSGSRACCGGGGRRDYFQSPPGG